jgi:hypothetical protein
MWTNIVREWAYGVEMVLETARDNIGINIALYYKMRMKRGFRQINSI